MLYMSPSPKGACKSAKCFKASFRLCPVARGYNPFIWEVSPSAEDNLSIVRQIPQLGASHSIKGDLFNVGVSPSTEIGLLI